jgi:hypothetical protein
MFGACTQLDARRNPALSTADMSSSRNTRHNIQTYESGVTSQLAGSASHGSNGHSTAIEPMSTGTSDLRQKSTARQIMNTWIMGSKWLHEDEMEPRVGDPGVPICALQLAERGQSIYCCFLVSVKGRKGKILGYKSASDPTAKPDRHRRAIEKERAKFGHCPFKCPRDHDPDW